jgi:hypothetical protein
VCDQEENHVEASSDALQHATVSQVSEELAEETFANFKRLILRDVRERLEPGRGDDPLVVAPVLSRKELEERQRGCEPDLGRDRQAAGARWFSLTSGPPIVGSRSNSPVGILTSSVLLEKRPQGVNNWLCDLAGLLRIGVSEATILEDLDGEDPSTRECRSRVFLEPRFLGRLDFRSRQ